MTTYPDPRAPRDAADGTSGLTPEPRGDGAADVAPEATLIELASTADSGIDVEAKPVVPEAPPRTRPGVSPTAAFAGGALLALVGIVSLVLSATGLVKPAASIASIAPASPPSPSVPIASPVVITPVDLAHGRSIGVPTAPVKVEVWEDFQCPICARWNASVKDQLISTYVRPGKIDLTYRDFIVIGRESIVAAVAARIAEREGKFWPFADRLFANQIGENAGSFAPARLVAIAAALGMDWRAFQTTLFDETEDAATIKVLQDNQDEGTKLGITGTPSVVVNGALVPKNDWASVSAAIDAAITGGNPSASRAPSTSPSPSAGT